MDLLAIAQFDDVIDPIQTNGGDAEFPLGVNPAQPGQFGVVGGHPAFEDRLGQRRTVIGFVGLIADDDQPPLETVLPQGFRGAQARKGRPDDNDLAAGAELLENLVERVGLFLVRLVGVLAHSVSRSAGGSNSRMIACTGQEATARSTC